jgi:hypothetical protein
MDINLHSVNNVRINKAYGKYSDCLTLEWVTKDPGKQDQFGSLTLFTKDIEFLVRRLQRCLDGMQPGVDSKGCLIRDVIWND